MNLVYNQDIDRSKWMELLNSSAFSSPFQTPEFYDLFNSTEKLSADAFAVEENGKYLAVVVVTIHKEKGVKGFFSKRGIVYGGPVVKSEDQALELLLEAVKNDYRRKVIYLEIRNHFDYSEYNSAIVKSGYEFHGHLNVQLKTKGREKEEILSGMKYNRRRQIRFSYEHGAIVRLAENENEVRQLYNILDDLYRTRVKLPLIPYVFFDNLIKNKVGKVFVVVHNDQIIGGSFCIYYEGMSINTMYYCGLRNYHKKIFPTHLAIMGIIEFALENDLELMDFMGAGKPEEDYGVRQYKLEFGGDLVEHGRYKVIFKPQLYQLGLKGLKLMAKFK